MKSFVQKIWPFVVIILLWGIFSYPHITRGLVPFPSDYLVTFFPPWSSEFGMPVKNNAMPDIITQIYPWKQFTIDTWKSGEVPLWNPYAFSGTPHAGNYQTAVFSPFNLLFFVLPFVDAWSILILLQPLLAGLFMYLFVRSLDRSQEASLLSAIAFMFCGFMVVWMAYGTLGYAALFLPLIFWGIHGLKEKAGKWNAVAISLGIALSFLSGHFQVSMYVIAAAFAYILWTAFLVKSWKRGIRLIVPVVAGLCLAAPQILLGIHSFLASTRGLTILKGDVIPWQYLVTLVGPDFFGNPVTKNDWFGHYAEWAGFIGVVPFLLALYAVVRKKASDTWFFILLTVLALAFALPTPLNDLLYILKIPVLSGSAASRIIIIASFSLAVLTAYGLDELIDDWKHGNFRQSAIFCVTAAGLLAVIWAILLFGKFMDPDKLAIATRNFIVPSAFVIGTVLLFAVGFVKNTWLKIIIIDLLIIATAVDMLRFAVKWLPFEPRQYVFPPVPSIRYLQKQIGIDRVFGNIGSGEVGTEFHLPLVEGYDAVYQGRYGEFINAVSKGYVYPGTRSVVQFDKNGLYKTEALQLLGIKYIYHSLSDGRNVWVFPYWDYLKDGTMHQVFSDEKYEIFEYNNVFPRAFLASAYTVVTDPQGIVNMLFGSTFDRRNSLVLEEKPVTQPQSGSGSVSVTSYTPSRVTIETSSAGPKLLFLSDEYDTGWKAIVDGKETKIYRADYDFRAVALTAGHHVVQFRYEPEELRWGIILSIAGLAALVYLTANKS